MMKQNFKQALKAFTVLSTLCLVISCNQSRTETDHSLSFFENSRKEIAPRFTNLPVNEIQPDGWIKTIMVQDISVGFVAKLDSLVPQIFNDDLYASAQRKSLTDIPNAGNMKLTGADWEISMQWWNSETQGNWWDGYVRNAYMTRNEIAMAKADQFANRILASQDSDDYIGIYGKDLRYNHEGDNGELWSQATLFRTLLGYYELNGRKEVLQAVEKAMDLTMRRYNQNAASPFKVKNDFGGVSHGLVLTDVCETLYRLTGEKKYNDYAVYLYREFSKYPIDKQWNDVSYNRLIARDSLFTGHSVHTYEHLRSLLLAYNLTGYPELQEAYNNALYKLSYCLLPGGAGFGDEWILGKKANADSTAAEYCGMLELRNFYLSALQKTGLVEFADKAERLTFNDMQGTRSGDGKGITYCKTDNCIVLNGKSPHSDFKAVDVRYKYSPTHADAAVCCNPNYGRNFPYYVGNMWMKAADGFAAVLYGPVTVTSTYRGEPVKIVEQTNYPFSDEIDFSVTVEKETEFTIYLRKPGWSKKVSVASPGASVKEENGFYVIRKKWKTGDVIHLAVENEIQTEQTFDHQITLQRGAFVYAFNIPFREESIKDYSISGFRDFMVFATDTSYKYMKLIAAENKDAFGFTYTGDENNVNQWYNGHTHLSGKVFNTKTNMETEIELIPMGGTMLRIVTFPSK